MPDSLDACEFSTPRLAEAKERDQADELASFRQLFFSQDGTIYLDGNSLGLLSAQSEQKVLDALRSWKSRGIYGWTEGENPWFFMAEEIGRRMAVLVGARLDEVVAVN